MTRDEITRRMLELADECDKLAGKAEKLSFPIGQAVYNAAANLYDAAAMADRAKGGTR